MVAHTRMVAGILLRVVRWKQLHFRPHKALPRDIHFRPFMPRRLTSSGPSVFAEMCMSTICLGIPYYFANRQSHGQARVEEGVMRPGPMATIGGSIALVAALILSASVTFLTLPGLDDAARTVIIVSTLLSAASLASSVVALFRHRVAAERRSLLHENYTVSSATTIILSLPAVLLAWSIIVFVTAIVIYVFRGGVVGKPDWTEFSEFTKWTTVGVLAFGAAALIITAFVARR